MKGFRSERSYTGVPHEGTVIATYERPSPFGTVTRSNNHAPLTHPYLFPDWTTALHLVAHWLGLDERRLSETVISRWLGPVRRPTRLFPWFAEEFPGADPTEGLQLLPSAVVRAVRDQPVLTFPYGCRSIDGVPLDGRALTSKERTNIVQLLDDMRASWSRGDWLIAQDEGSRERLISFQDVKFEEGSTVKPTDAERLHMHNYGRAVLLSETMRKHLGFSVAHWLIWADAPDPFSDESLADTAPERALNHVNDDFVRRIEQAEIAPAVSRELRAELVEWLNVLVDGWKRGFWVTYSV